MANKALQFDGAQNYFNAGKLGSLGANILEKGFHSKFKIKTSQTTKGEFGYYHTGNNSIMIGFNINAYPETTSEGRISFYFMGTGGVVSGYTTNVNVFNNGSEYDIDIYADFSTNTVTIKLDGSPLAVTYLQKQTITSFGTINYDFYIGARHYGGADNYLNCIVDNFSIGTADGTDYGIYNFNEGTGTTSVDLSGNGDDGTLQKGAGSYPAWVDGLTPYPPTVASGIPTTVTTASFLAVGGFTFNGGEDVSEQGFVYATTANPTVVNTKALATPETYGEYSATISGLTNGVIYHYRAFATNSAGITYGADITVQAGASVPSLGTLSIDPGRLDALLSCSVTNDGGTPIIRRGFVIGSSLNPTLSDTDIVVSGSTGSYSDTATSLTNNTTYHARAYAENGAGLIYGSDVQFTTDPLTAPVLTTNSVTTVKHTTAIPTATMTDGGGSTVTERGFVIGTSANPTTSDTKFAVVDYLSVYKWLLTGLTPNTTYHLRSYAINSTGTGYGSDISFTTLAAAAPRMSGYYDMPAMDIKDTSATLTGYIGDNCGATITERGFVLSTSPNPTTSDTKIVVAGDEAWFINAEATTLTPDTFYHYRTFATNSVGTSYGEDEIFKTLKNGESRIDPISPFFGLNVGNNVINGDVTDWNEIKADVEYHKSIGLKNVRIASMTHQYVRGSLGGGYGLQKWADMRQIIALYMQAGINVQYTVQYGGDWGTTAPWNQYDADYRLFLQEEIAYAMSLGIKRIQLENEMEIKVWGSGATRAQVYNWYQALAVWAREVQYQGESYNGILTVALVPDNDTEFTSRGRGLIPELGFDSYGTITQFVTKNNTFFTTHGDRGYCSEWGIHNPENSPHYRSSKYFKQTVLTKWKYLQQKQRYHVAFYHTWKNLNDSGEGQQNQDNWSASMLTGEVFDFFFAITGQRSPIVY